MVSMPMCLRFGRIFLDNASHFSKIAQPPIRVNNSIRYKHWNTKNENIFRYHRKLMSSTAAEEKDKTDPSAEKSNSETEKSIKEQIENLTQEVENLTEQTKELTMKSMKDAYVTVWRTKLISILESFNNVIGNVLSWSKIFLSKRWPKVQWDDQDSQYEQTKDKYKRALADGENMRLRLTKQIEDAKLFGIQGFCKDLLEVADILAKATECVPKEEVSDSNPHLKNLYEGLTMTEAELKKVFRRHGLVPVNPLNEKFNPNLHEALFQQEVEGKEAGTVVVVSKIGYKLHERVVRPALVGVAKAP